MIKLLSCLRKRDCFISTRHPATQDKISGLIRFILLIGILLLPGCQSDTNPPDISVQILLDSVEKHDTRLFFQFTDPGAQQRTYSELVESYLGEALDQISINMNLDAIGILFRDLVYTVTYQDRDTAIVNVTGYISNLATGKEAPINADFSTFLIEGKWYVSFPDKAYRANTLVFIPHEIEQAPSPREGYVKWTIYGSIKNVGSKYYFGAWPVTGKVLTADGSSIDSRFEFFCQPDYVVQTPTIQSLVVPPAYQVRGVPGCDLALVVETSAQMTPQTMVMNNFRDSDLTKTRPVGNIFELMSTLTFPETLEIERKARLVVEGVSTNFSKIDGRSGQSLVIYIRLINLLSAEQRFDGITAYLIGSNGYITLARIVNCSDPSLPILRVGPGETIERKVCIPLESDPLRTFNFNDGFTIVLYFQDHEIASTYRFNMHPYLLFSDTPIVNFQNYYDGRIIFPGIVSQSTVSWNTGVAMMLYGFCTRIERLDAQTLRLTLKDGRIILVLIPDFAIVDETLVVCGNACPQIVRVAPTPQPAPRITPRATQPAPSGLPTGWIIVVGAFDNYPQAVKYTERFHTAGYRTRIYFRNNYYRTVIPGYSTEAQAQGALPGVQAINNAAYLRELSQWCPFPAITSTYITCK